MSVEVHILASGSDGNCTVVKHDDRAVVIDAGLSCKRLFSLMDVNGLDKECIDAILITHEHTDHTSGAGVMARKLNVPIMCNERTFNACDFGNVMYSPISMMNRFRVANMDVISLPTSHDAVEPSAYLMDADGVKVLVATDTGRILYPVEHALEESDIAVIESNYDKRMLREGPYPPSLKRHIDSDMGHMCNVDTGEILKRTMKNPNRRIFLAHLSRHNNTPDIARETVSEITGIKRYQIDCLECKGDTRIMHD